MLKNVNSLRYQGLIKIPALFRLLLTGTPLQNNLQELAALLAFILPGVFKEVETDLNFIFKAKVTTLDADHAASSLPREFNERGLCSLLSFCEERRHRF